MNFFINGVAIREAELEIRLNAIADANRGVYVIREDLTARKLSGITKFFWCLFGVFCPCMRASIFHSNLNNTRRIIIDLGNDPQLLANQRLLAVYQRARGVFFSQYPERVRVEIIRPSVTHTHVPRGVHVSSAVHAHVQAGRGHISPTVQTHVQAGGGNAHTVQGHVQAGRRAAVPLVRTTIIAPPLPRHVQTVEVPSTGHVVPGRR